MRATSTKEKLLRQILEEEKKETEASLYGATNCSPRKIILLPASTRLWEC
jgi:hypothetical protein